MEISKDSTNVVGEGDGGKDTVSTSSTSEELALDRAQWLLSTYLTPTVKKAADTPTQNRLRGFSCVIIVATVTWLILEHSGLPVLSICSDVLLILIVLLFLHFKYASFRNKQPCSLPGLVVSEEMVVSAAASFRVRINNMLLIAHDITLGKDFILFFKVVVCLWVLSVIGSYCSFFTLAYIGTIISVIVLALYRKNEDGATPQQFPKNYKVVDESVFGRLPRNLSKDKDL